jgi:hypothetical protein
VSFKAPDGKPVQVAKVATSATDTLLLNSDKSLYKQGEAPVLTVKSDKDCFLTVTDVDDKNKGGVIFPNKFQQDNRIKGGVENQIPGANALFRFRLDDKGAETVVAVCTVQKFDVDGIKHDFTNTDLTTVNDYSGTVAKSIAKTRQIRAISVQAASAAKVETSAGAAKTEATTAVAQSADAVTRAAIKIQVQ